MTPRRRTQGAVLLALMLLAGVFELLTVGAIAPLLSAVGGGAGAGSLPSIPLLPRPGRNSVAALAAAFAGIAAVAAALRVTLTWATQKFVFRLGYDLEVRAYATALCRPYAQQVRTNSSEVIAGLDKVGLVSSAVFLPILMGLSSAVIAAFILTALVIVRPVDAVIAATGFSAAYLLVALVFRGGLAGRSRRVATGLVRRLQALQEGLGAIRDIILDQSQAAYTETFAAIDLDLRDSQAAIGTMGAAPRFVIEGAGMIMIALLVIWLSATEGGVVAALPLLGALALAAQRLLPLLQQIYNSWAQVAASRQTVLDVAALLAPGPAPLAPVPAEVDAPPAPFRRSLRLHDVSFRYTPDSPPVLDRLRLEIARGDRVGIIGRTGSGKSTALDIVMGLLEPDSGELLVDDAALTGAGRPRWRRGVSHVPQAIFLSDASLLENIALGVPAGRIDEARARDAARQADLAGFIEALPQGYATRAGERGVRLSGGQRQRIGIARALYKRAQVLVLDEATSALDEATEAQVLDSLDRLDRDLTILMIAHRLNTLRRCDYVVRLEGGRVVQRGPYVDFAAPPLAVAG